jgi:hypothetical protein
METVFKLSDEVYNIRPSNDSSPLAVPAIIGAFERSRKNIITTPSALVADETQPDDSGAGIGERDGNTQPIDPAIQREDAEHEMQADIPVVEINEPEGETQPNDPVIKREEATQSPASAHNQQRQRSAHRAGSFLDRLEQADRALRSAGPEPGDQDKDQPSGSKEQGKGAETQPNAKKPLAKKNKTRKRVGDPLTQPEGKKQCLPPPHPRFPRLLPTNGLQASAIVPKLYGYREANQDIPMDYSDAAMQIGQAELFLPAVRQTLQNAISIARDRTPRMAQLTVFNWKGDVQTASDVSSSKVGMGWDRNIHNMTLAAQQFDTATVEFRYIEYQQKWQVHEEMKRRMAKGVKERRAETDIYDEVGRLLKLSNGTSSGAKTKTKVGLMNLFKIDMRHWVFILSRPRSDKWRSILRGEHGRIDTALITKWTDLVGPLCWFAWMLIDRVTRRPESRIQDLREAFIKRDEAAGLVYTDSQRKAWGFHNNRWTSIDTALDFLAMVGDANFPGLDGPRGEVAGGSSSEPGRNELYGFIGDREKFMPYGLTLLPINGSMAMVSVLDLQEGDYLGTVPGRLHSCRDIGHSHELCFAGPAGVMLDPTPSPLWPLISSGK